MALRAPVADAAVMQLAGEVQLAAKGASPKQPAVLERRASCPLESVRGGPSPPGPELLPLGDRGMGAIPVHGLDFEDEGPLNFAKPEGVCEVSLAHRIQSTPSRDRRVAELSPGVYPF